MSSLQCSLGLCLCQLPLQNWNGAFQLCKTTVLLLTVACACLMHSFFDAPFGDKAFLHGGQEIVKH